MHDKGSTLTRRSNDERDARLKRLEAIFAPYVREVVAGEARRRTLRIAITTLTGLATSMDVDVGPTEESIIERALLGESRMIVLEWTLLLREHAFDGGSTLRLSSLDEAMLPPFPDDLARIHRECCERRMAGPAMTRDVLRRVRSSLPAGESLPADAAAYLHAHDIALVQ